MKIKNIIKNKKVIGAVLTSVCVAGIAFGSMQYNNYKNIQQLKQEVSSYYSYFEEETDKDTKLDLLNEMKSKSDKYNNKDVVSSYELAIEESTEWFKEYYNQILTDNKLNIDEVSDIEQINKSKENLVELNEMIVKDNVLDKQDVESYNNKINKLTESYDERVKNIEKEEAEKKAKEEAEKKKAEEEKAKQEQTSSSQNNSSSNSNKNTSSTTSNNTSSNSTNNSSSSNSNKNNATSNNASTNTNTGSSNNGSSSSKPSNSGSSSSNSSNSSSSNSNSSNNSSSNTTSKPSNSGSSNNSNSGKVNVSKLEPTWKLDPETGEKIPGSLTYIDRSTGNVYDPNGNFLFNAFDW